MKKNDMQDFANIFWFILGGEIIAAIWALFGCLFCLTVVGKPLGMDLFRCARFAVAPFGKAPQSTSSKHPVIDLFWLPLGLILLLIFLFMGLAYTITIVGIPFGKQCFKMVVLAMGPFNVEFEDETADEDFPKREEY